jgi:hypothetical protein
MKNIQLDIMSAMELKMLSARKINKQRRDINQSKCNIRISCDNDKSVQRIGICQEP